MPTIARELADLAALIADPGRALILSRLMDGRAQTAGELALVAGVTPQTASWHLGRLVQHAVLKVERRGPRRLYRLATPLERPDLAVDVLELGVAVGVTLPLLRLAVGLEVVAGLRQEAGHRLMADVMPHRGEGLGEVACALARPEQGRHRIAARGGIDEVLKVLEQGGIAGGQAMAAATRAADARALGVGIRAGVGTGVEFGESAVDGGT